MPAIITRGAASARGFGWSGNTAAALVGFTGFTAPRIMNGSSTTAYMYGVAVNTARRFVAVGAYKAAYSTNGTTWTTPATVFGSSVMFDVAVNSAGLFVAVGSSGASTSTDGITWTAVVAISGFTANAVAVNSSGLFVAVGSIVVSTFNRFAFSSSSDGVTWTAAAQIDSGSGLYGSATGVAVSSAGVFAVIGNLTGPGGNNNTVATSASSDGITWAAMSPTGTSNTVAAKMTVNSSGLFVAVGNRNSSSGIGEAGTVYFSSSPSVSFSQATMGGVSGNNLSNLMKAVAVNNTTGLFVAVGIGVGTGGKNGLPVYSTSSDGTTWTVPTRMNGAYTPATLAAVAVASTGLFVTVGSGYGNTTNSTAPIYAYSWNTAGTAGQQAYTVAGTYTWVAPAGVTKISAVALGHGGVGGTAGCVYVPVPGPCCSCCGYSNTYGGGGGGGGAIAWANNQTVVPANSYTVTVRAANAGAVNTSFSTLAVAGGGLASSGSNYGTGGTVITGTGYSGGTGGSGSSTSASTSWSGKAGGGGGAAGYASAGGNGGNGSTASDGQSKTGGGGGGASGQWCGGSPTQGWAAGTGSGGSFIMGTIAPFCNTTGTGGKYNCPVNSGSGGKSVYTLTNYSGGARGGTYGRNGGGPSDSCACYGSGGGGSAISSGTVGCPGLGTKGAVRVIWPGCTRSYPSTCVQDV